MRFVRLMMLAMWSATALQAQGDAFARVRGLVGAGDMPRARALADSLVRVTPEESPAFADALYWRARAADDVASARRDYLRLALEHPHAPVTEDALLRLGTSAYDRGDRASARRFLQQQIGSFPDGKDHARASFALARALMDDGAVLDACAQLDDAKRLSPASDVEFRGQVSYLAGRCPAARADSASRAMSSVRSDTNTPTAAETPSNAPSASRATTGPAWSVQVAAFSSKADAAALVKRLTKRGYDARVTVAAPYRVRVGRFPSREKAASKAQQMKNAGMTAIVVEAERP